jgi:hypothetical protein
MDDKERENEQLRKCLTLIKDQIQCVQKMSYDALKNEDMSHGVYHMMYKINQESHDIKRTLDLYF